MYMVTFGLISSAQAQFTVDIKENTTCMEKESIRVLGKNKALSET